MSDPQLRFAENSDIEPMIELLRLLFLCESDFDFNALRQRRGLEMMLAQENAVIMVVEVEKQVAGMASGQLTISTAEGGYALLVEDVVVDPAFRRRGLGKKLLQGLASWAEKRKVKRLQLLADRGNRGAIEFYEKVGWQPTQLNCLRRFSC